MLKKDSFKLKKNLSFEPRDSGFQKKIDERKTHEFRLLHIKHKNLPSTRQDFYYKQEKGIGWPRGQPFQKITLTFF